MHNARDELIFWFDQPPKVGKGAFNYISEHWGNKVYYVCCHDFSQIRKSAHWDDGDFGMAEVILLSEQTNPTSYVMKIFETHPEAVHVFAGFQNIIASYLDYYIAFPALKKKIVIMTERPNVYGNFLEKALRMAYVSIKYRLHYLKYHKYVSVLLPLGVRAIDEYKTFGWPYEKMYNFMYNPLTSPGDTAIEKAYPDKFCILYVGRFYDKTKGIFTLLRALSKMKSDGWMLDLVGGYGKDTSLVMKKIEMNNRIKYIGLWPSNKVCENIKKYDIIVVPSNYDGWNMLPNEAIAAHIGCVVSDNATSDELIINSGAGIVFQAGNADQLAEILDNAIERPDMVEEWKQKAKDYSPVISPSSVGEYLADILGYSFYLQPISRPVCPWLTRMNHNDCSY